MAYPKKIKIEMVSLLPFCAPNGKVVSGRMVFSLLQAFRFWINGVLHVIPKGFEFDGDSIPFGLRNSFNPSDPRTLVAALIHDWLYAAEIYARLFADAVYLEVHVYLGANKIRRSLKYIAVAGFGWTTYKRHTPESIMAIRALSGISIARRPLYNELTEIPEYLTKSPDHLTDYPQFFTEEALK